MSKYNFFLRSFLLVFSAMLLWSCGDDTAVTPAAQKSKKEMISYRWRLDSAMMGTGVLPISSPGLGDVRADFSSATYMYIYPNQENLADMDSVSGSWRFSADSSRVFLNRDIQSLPEFEWQILELTPGNLKTSFTGPSPIDPTQTITYTFRYRIDR